MASRWMPNGEFSPYSRGWSQPGPRVFPFWGILPVFAGMVPEQFMLAIKTADSPRIRGDGPNR